MNIWQVAREYAHLAEAGGVKNGPLLCVLLRCHAVAAVHPLPEH